MRWKDREGNLGRTMKGTVWGCVRFEMTRDYPSKDVNYAVGIPASRLQGKLFARGKHLAIIIMGMVVKSRRFGGFFSHSKLKQKSYNHCGEKVITENRKCSKAIQGHSEIEGYEETSEGTASQVKEYQKIVVS